MLVMRVLLAAILTAAAIARPAAIAQDGLGTLVESRESLYNNIYIYRQGPLLSMTFGYNRNIYTESIYDTRDDRALPVTYTRYMTAALMYPPRVHSVLEIGFGGGRTSWYLHRSLPDVSVTTVELDPTVIALAEKYFGVRPERNFDIVNSDGRVFLMHSKQRYDAILIDAYRGPFVPFQLLTQQFYALVKQHLNPGGVVAQNVEPTTMLFDSAVHTIHSVFPQIDLYYADGNIVTIAYDEPHAASALAAAATRYQRAYRLRYDLRAMLPERKHLASEKGVVNPGARILTDDFAPVEALQAITVHNRKWPAPQSSTRP